MPISRGSWLPWIRHCFQCSILSVFDNAWHCPANIFPRFEDLTQVTVATLPSSVPYSFRIQSGTPICGRFVRRAQCDHLLTWRPKQVLSRRLRIRQRGIYHLQQLSSFQDIPPEPMESGRRGISHWSLCFRTFTGLQTSGSLILKCLDCT